jgi:cell division septation protein DedD
VNGEGGTSGKSGRMPRAAFSLIPCAALVRVATVVSVLSALSASSAPGQTDPRLVEVIRHAQEGQGDSARIKVRRLLTATAPSDTLYPQIVYTQAMVANDAAEMRRQLQRVAVEHSSSSWADDALLRLVQLDYASANLDGAARNLERIRLDYPDSPLLPQSAYWAARTYFDQKKPELACRWIAQGMAASTGSVEVQNQLGYLNQRCGQFAGAGAQQPGETQPSAAAPLDSQRVVAALPPDTARPTAAPPDSVRTSPPVSSAVPVPRPAVPPEPPKTDSVTAVKQPAPGVHYRVQITAVRSATTARSLATKLKSRGFNPITVEEGGLFKVRVGNYPTKAEAVAAVPEIKAKLGGSPFVVAGS